MGLEPYYQDDLVVIYHGDCREILPSLKGISAVVTDCPYELGFMSKSWDKQGISFQPDTWRLIREACLPGAMLLSFGGTRTSHRIACAIEDAGWQIRDTICWVYGSGFPKSLDISKALDKKAGAKREIVGRYKHPARDDDWSSYPSSNKDYLETNTFPVKPNRNLTTPATPEAKLWEGYGTALKPAYEPIIVAMNPLDGTFANNALKHKVAGLNIDECRVKPQKGDRFGGGGLSSPHKGFMSHTKNTYQKGDGFRDDTNKGRFPANFIHDGSQEVMELFPETSKGWAKATKGKAKGNGSVFGIGGINPNRYDMGGQSAARFFYCAKSSRRERDAGLEDMPDKQIDGAKGNEYLGLTSAGKSKLTTKNNHPTVKPLSLMTYLCKLVKMPEYNLILDPFCGSGTTLLACKKLGIKAIGIDSNEQYCEITAKRCRNE